MTPDLALDGLEEGDLVLVIGPTGGRSVRKIDKKYGKNFVVGGDLFVRGALRPTSKTGATLRIVTEKDLEEAERDRLWEEVLRPLAFVKTPMEMEKLRQIAEHIKEARQIYLAALRGNAK